MTGIVRFYKGETLEIPFTCEDRDDQPLDLTGGTVTIAISTATDQNPTLQFSSAPQIVITDAVNGAGQITLTPTDLNALTEGVKYYYDLWADDAAGVRYRQEGGLFRLKAAVQPT